MTHAEIDYHDDFATSLKKINDYEMTRDERAAISILNAYKVGYESGMEDLEQEPCDDAISRILKKMWNCRGKHTTSIDKVAMEQIIRDELPSVTQKSKTGHWILTDDDFVYCSECEDSYYPRPIDASWYYCPNCGAKMVGPQERSE